MLDEVALLIEMSNHSGWKCIHLLHNLQLLWKLDLTVCCIEAPNFKQGIHCEVHCSFSMSEGIDIAVRVLRCEITLGILEVFEWFWTLRI